MAVIYPWLSDQFESFKKLSANNTLHHANVLVGPSDFGVESMMRELSQYLLCERPAQIACGECASCRYFLSGNHPDYHLLRPVAPSKTIKIDEWRSLVPVLSQKAARGGRQVVCIEQADTMQAGTANALLKTLEEPPGRLVFILWAKQLEALLPTVRSRTQHFFLQTAQTDVMQQWVEETLSVDPAKPWLSSSYERPLAIPVMQEQEYFAKRDAVLDMMKSMQAGGLSLVKAAEQCADWSRSLLLQSALTIAADAVKLSLSYPEQSLVNIDKVAEISAIFKRIPVEKVLEYYRAVQVQCSDEHLPQVLNRGLQDCQLWLAFDAASQERIC